AKYTTPLSASTPASWDWDTQGMVIHPKDQGDCGSCWAFATVGATESSWAIRGKGLYDLSEQQLIDCDSWGDDGCDGGDLDHAAYYVKQNGIMGTVDYPYMAVDGKTCNYDSKKVIARTKGFTDVTSDEGVMADALYTAGPIAIAINATPLQFYSTGVLNPRFCPSSTLDHGVLLVGYGTDEETGLDFWRIKNSWGMDWGESGFFRMVRGVNACGVAEWPVQPVV
ncbi:peptidase C1A, partial [Kipferlia bialata]